ncbi:hypothetical protein JW979_08215, partial [bacterium]|nr:hypothetical protein [candidate division CSSED10-310 bacterium]
QKVAVKDIADEEGQVVVETSAKFGGIANYMHVDMSKADIVCSGRNSTPVTLLNPPRFKRSKPKQNHSEWERFRLQVIEILLVNHITWRCEP